MVDNKEHIHCCQEICNVIEGRIGGNIHYIDEISYDPLSDLSRQEKRSRIHDAEVRIENLKDLKHEITKRSPYCKCL